MMALAHRSWRYTNSFQNQSIIETEASQPVTRQGFVLRRRNSVIEALKQW
ncbi:hypothetical protein BB561_006799 [Smittium simulii]|uniref:Uncharacterized protein n=1 Tax=Smittium simulii TaxID=133385 RepID=A0A2T9Y1D1_9FUNG|nr:hypothetical protein BB561_006799 [Smittium simulii]